MEIKIIKALPKYLKPKPDETKLGFGRHFTDHMFSMKYKNGTGWHDPVIEPYHLLQLDPTAMCLHYGQEIFEGLKAYRGKKEEIYLFRPLENIRRMNTSAERLCMPPIDETVFFDALKKFVLLEKEWIPREAGSSLYIRPTMIATEAALGVHPSGEYLFFIIAGPVGAYYPHGFSPTKIYVSDEYVRAAPGGTGQIKAAGNYAASLYASRIATNMGYTQVLWLDAREKKYVEEVGTSNIFFLIGDELVTPPLGGTILPGVTRDSVLKLAVHFGVKVSERPLAIDEVIAAIENGTLQESFASGTAAVISPVGQIFYNKKEYLINNGKTGALAQRLFNEIMHIQYGNKQDPFNWRVQIG
ncbi:MAG: branched-chain amino acid aminotransferase [Smithellaceae bacterium]|nr:branched-chain amino acid aminotransferase [Syntrophaceae bacterium]MDD4239855.1 branched-chain amino acid aminotransferase [Smithellaceae bacterium]NLX52616.1 branched-chain amino acid aminotransferase [Deltaproteobacteria bacterium]